MKVLNIDTGGHRRSNEDLLHLQEAFQEVFSAILQPLQVANIKAVWFKGGVLVTTAPNTQDLSDGYLGVSGSAAEMYYVQSAANLDTSGGKKIFLSRNTDNGTAVVYADALAKFVHKNNYLTAYTAVSKANAADIDFAVDTAIYGDWLTKAINFDGSNYLPSVQDNWHIVGAAGEPNLNSIDYSIDTLLGLKFKKNQAGIVSVSGGVFQITANPNNPVFYLPFNYRPAVETNISIISNLYTASCLIGTNGSVVVYDATSVLGTHYDIFISFQL